MGNGTITMTGAEYDALAGKIATLEAENAKLRAELERRAVDGSRLDADDVRAACQNAIEVFAGEENAEQCREVAEYMREVLLVDLDRAAAPSAPATVQGVNQQLLEALEKVDSEHEILGWMKACELRRGRGSFGIAVMSDELALDWQSHQKNLERLIELRHAAIAAARQEGKV